MVNKVSKPIVLNEAQWLQIYNSLADRYRDRPSVLLIRSKMREELGFTARRHAEWKMEGDHWERCYTIRVDFYSEAAESWFRLSFL